MGKCAITLAALFFGLVALIHLGRIFCPFEIAIGGFKVPEWASYVGFVVAGLFSVYLFQARHCFNSCTKDPTDQK